MSSRSSILLYKRPIKHLAFLVFYQILFKTDKQKMDGWMDGISLDLQRSHPNFQRLHMNDTQTRPHYTVFLDSL